MGRHSPTTVRRRRPALIALISAVAAVALAAGGFYAWQRIEPGAASTALAAQPKCDRIAQLEVTADPAVAPIVKQVAAQFDRVKAHCSKITVASQESADTASVLAGGNGGGIGVWIPDSPVWVNRMQSIAASLGHTAPSVRALQAIASSPVLFALPSTRADEIGDKPLSWSRVLNGTITTLLPNPEASGPSLAGLLALAQHARGNTQLLNASLIALGKSIPDSSGAALADTTTATNLTIAIATEQEVASYNTAHANQQLTAVYPSDGTLSVQFPYLLVGAQSAASATPTPAPSAKPSTKPTPSAKPSAHSTTSSSPAASAPPVVKSDPGLAAEFEHALLAQPELFSAAGFRNGAGKGSVDQPGIVPTPSPAPAASDGKTELTLYKTWGVVNLRGRMLGVIDVSGSMAEPAGGGLSRIQVFQQAAMGAIQRFSGDVELGLWMFSTNQDGTVPYKQISPIAPLGDPAHMQDLANQVAALPSHVSGDTGLYDTVIAAVRNVRQSYDPNYLDSVVVITDGVDDDRASTTTLQQTIATLTKENDPSKPVPVIMIGFGPDTDMDAMTQIAKATGGAAYSAQQPQDLGNVLTTALTERSCRPDCSAG